MQGKTNNRVSTLSPHEEALIEVFRLGPKALGSASKFILWLNQPSLPLGRKIPLKLLLSKKAGLVRDALRRIEHGIYS